MYYNYVFLLKKIFFYYSSLWFSKNNIILVLKYLWKIGFELNLDYIWDRVIFYFGRYRVYFGLWLVYFGEIWKKIGDGLSIMFKCK